MNEAKHVMDIIEERTGIFALEPNTEKRQEMVKAAIRGAAADMYRESEWFVRQMRLCGCSKREYRKYAMLDNFGPTAFQELLFAISMLFIDSGKSDEELADIMKQKTS